MRFYLNGKSIESILNAQRETTAKMKASLIESTDRIGTFGVIDKAADMVEALYGERLILRLADIAENVEGDEFLAFAIQHHETTQEVRRFRGASSTSPASNMDEAIKHQVDLGFLDSIGDGFRTADRSGYITETDLVIRYNAYREELRAQDQAKRETEAEEQTRLYGVPVNSKGKKITGASVRKTLDAAGITHQTDTRWNQRGVAVVSSHVGHATVWAEYNLVGQYDMKASGIAYTPAKDEQLTALREAFAPIAAALTDAGFAVVVKEEVASYIVQFVINVKGWAVEE